MQKVFETMAKVCSGELSKEQFMRLAPELYDMIAPPPEKFFSDDRHEAVKQLTSEIKNTPDFHRGANTTSQPWIEVSLIGRSRKIIVELRDNTDNKKIGTITTVKETNSSDYISSSWKNMPGSPSRHQYNYTGKRITDVIKMIREILSE